MPASSKPNTYQQETREENDDRWRHVLWQCSGYVYDQKKKIWRGCQKSRTDWINQNRDDPPILWYCPLHLSQVPL